LVGWPGNPEGVWFAPGRVNLIREHTDYSTPASPVADHIPLIVVS